MDGLKKVITRLEPNMDAQVKATNQVRTNYSNFNSNNLLLQMLLVMIVQIVVAAVSRYTGNVWHSFSTKKHGNNQI